jgi:hypothetical protein
MTTTTLIQKSKNIWDTAINSSNNNTDNFLEIEHDIHYQTVCDLTDYILASMYKHGYRSVTVGDCLGDPKVNWYRTPGVATPQTISVDGSCSATVTCLGSTFGPCCSQNGFCGLTDAYCAAGCEPISGSCNDIRNLGNIFTVSSRETPTSLTSSTDTCTQSTLPSPTETVTSMDGSCSSRETCNGSTLGNCCSQYGYCG